MVAVVGCGGTGGFVAEGLCRLLDKKLDILLIDHDRVEEHNLVRQNFYRGDLGKFKSQALAERLSRNFGREVGYSVRPYHGSYLSNALIIGCVDNAAAREDIAGSIGGLNWWLDAGNGYHSGQVLIGNVRAYDRWNQECFDARRKTISRLPSPSMQLPSLLVPAPAETKPRDCAQAVVNADQSPVINQMMAALVLDIVYKLINGKLEWMGAYIDLESGSLSPVPATPEAVARITGAKLTDLVKVGKK
jgi:PRTRC genetic system ThiF family protein